MNIEYYRFVFSYHMSFVTLLL